jgi:predicted transposase/invertase (TIGR01784 family)
MKNFSIEFGFVLPRQIKLHPKNKKDFILHFFLYFCCDNLILEIMSKELAFVKGTVKKASIETSQSVSVISEVPKGRYINPRTDFGFKRIFGTESNKDLLIHFLNSVLKIDGKIVNLEYSNVEQRGRIKTERGAFFDLHCTTDKGEYIIVEMQNIPQPYFKDRVLYYVSFPILKQGERKRTWNFKLKPVYSVNLLNFRFVESGGTVESSIPCENKDKSERQYIHYVQLIDRRTGEVFNENLLLVLIELPDFDKQENELKTTEDCWIYILKNLDSFDDLPAMMRRNKIFRKLCEQAKLANLTPEELDMYDESLKKYRDMYTTKHIVKDFAKEVKKALAAKDKELAKVIAKNKMVIVNYQEIVRAKDNELAANQKELAAKDNELAELRRRLGLNGTI